MRTPTKRTLCLIIGLAVSSAVIPVAFGSSSYKCKHPGCDINAIGHRRLVLIPLDGKWYSLQKEKQRGDQ